MPGFLGSAFDVQCGDWTYNAKVMGCYRFSVYRALLCTDHCCRVDHISLFECFGSGHTAGT